MDHLFISFSLTYSILCPGSDLDLYYGVLVSSLGQETRYSDRRFAGFPQYLLLGYKSLLPNFLKLNKLNPSPPLQVNLIPLQNY